MAVLSSAGPSICTPPIGFGRSSTTTLIFRAAASSITYSHRRHVGVEARADVLQVDDDRVEAGEHLGGRPARRAVQRMNRQARLLVHRRRHGRVEDAANAVLRTEQGHERHAGCGANQVNRGRAVPGPAGVIRDQADAQARQRLESVRARHVDAGQHRQCRNGRHRRNLRIKRLPTPARRQRPRGIRGGSRERRRDHGRDARAKRA